MRLYILRHGIAVPHGDPDYAEDDRPLTKIGEKRTRQVAYGWKKLRIELDRVVTSPLPRAHKTAEILVRVLRDPDLLETSDQLKADQSAEAIAEWLPTRTEENLMIVGHNPHLSDLVGLLATGDPRSRICELKRAGVAALTSSQPGKWSIDWIAWPRLLRQMRDR